MTLPLFNRGFRPFYLLAGIFAILVMAFWLAIVTGLLPAPRYIGPMGWHAHELLLGFVMAVMAGFLLTAVPNWTGLPTPAGPVLAGLALLWLLGRIAMAATDILSPWLVVLLDVVFLPALAIALWLPLWRSRNHRNIMFPFILLVLAGANLVIHLQALEVLATGHQRTLLFILNVITLIMVVIGGRVIPLFTANAIPEVKIQCPVWVNRSAVVMVAIVLIMDLFTTSTAISGSVALLAAALNLMRLLYWQPFTTWRVPMLWILHLGYTWIVVSLTLKGFADLVPGLAPTVAIHALTVGAIGSLTLGMMCRVTLGHTGRTIVASASMTIAFALISTAAIVRVLIPIVAPEYYLPGIISAGLLWVLAFMLFVIEFIPILIQSRIDGKPG